MGFDLTHNLSLQLRELAQSPDLNLLLPAGIGDCAWVMAKLYPIAKRRGVKVWLPEGEQQRAGHYLDMIGVKHGYLKGLTTNWVWRRMGSPILPKSGWVSVQANIHLEGGSRIEGWYPELPLAYPKMKFKAKDEFKGNFALLFPGARNYMNGNLDVSQWVRIALQLRRKYGHVRLIGAGKDVEFLAHIIAKIGSDDHIIDRPFDDVAAAFTSNQCKAFIGVASGPLIAATAAGCKTVLAYPDHLHQMPGTWEPMTADTKWCFVRDMPKAIEEMTR